MALEEKCKGLRAVQQGSGQALGQVVHDCGLFVQLSCQQSSDLDFTAKSCKKKKKEKKTLQKKIVC
jgi:uncharacterized protein YhaN